MTHRQDLNSLSPSDRTTLVNLILEYLNDAVVRAHAVINHGDAHIFTEHRRYIEGLETFLSTRDDRFVPLPTWNPSNRIPDEFNIVKSQDNGVPRPRLENLNPNMPLPDSLRRPCNYVTIEDLARDANGWHGSVHLRVGGAMSLPNIASAAPIFWCWHAFFDELFYDWEQCRISYWFRLGNPSDRGTSLAVGQNHDGRLEVFLVGTSNDIWHNWQLPGSGEWFGWQMLGKPNDKGINLDAGKNTDGRLEVFLVGTSNDIWHNWQLTPGSGEWFGWQMLGKPNDKGINLDAGKNTDGRLEVFLVGTSNDIWHTWQTAPNNGWIFVR
jgi:hypothetical protein